MSKSLPEDFLGHGQSEHFAPETATAPSPLVLNPKAPWDTAGRFIGVMYTLQNFRTLHHFLGSFWRWTGTRYVELPAENLKADVYTFLNSALVTRQGDLLDRFKPTSRAVIEVVEALRARCQLPAAFHPPAWIEPDAGPPVDELVACSNGLLHVPSRSLISHRPSLFSTAALPIAYDVGAPPAREWLKFLESIWGPDFESVRALQEMFGYLVSGDTKYQKIFLVVGPPRAGKGTIAHVLNELLGKEAVAYPTLSSLVSNFGLEALIDKRLALISDARLSGRADVAVIVERLLSISGEDFQTIDRKYRPSWTGSLRTRFVIVTNEIPRLSESSGALSSRFVVLSLRNSFLGREDLGLRQRLLHELPSILNWSLEGLRRLQKRGHFVQPSCAADEVRQLKELGSPILAFVHERCDLAAGSRSTADELFQEWLDWCRAQGRDHPGVKQVFCRDLRAAFPALRLTQPRDEGGTRPRVYEGIALKGRGT